jgi:hypothetical protein
MEGIIDYSVYGAESRRTFSGVAKYLKKYKSNTSRSRTIHYWRRNQRIP